MTEKRQHLRVLKNFVLYYTVQNDNGNSVHITTQLKNISEGGLCFVTEEALTPGTILWIELKTPYLTDTAYLEGEVLGSHEKVAGMLYETRLRFENLTDEALFIIKKLMEFLEKENEHQK